jgi:5-(carboxyamino)imidazole ribonucleotide synthase
MHNNQDFSTQTPHSHLPFKYTGLYDLDTLNDLYLSPKKQQAKQVLGVLGGGQLGRMFTQSAQRMGFEVCVFCPEAKHDSPAAMIAEHHIKANFDDQEALRFFAKIVHAATTEFENIPYTCFEFLSHLELPVAPDANALKIAQHRILEKNFLKNAGVPVTEFIEIKSQQDAQNADDQIFPAILKTATLGYDGKGQFVVDDKESLIKLWLDGTLKNADVYILEKRLNLSHEISVIVSRGFDGQMQVFPVPQNLHHQGILMISKVPSPDTPQKLLDEAVLHAQTVATQMNYHGVLCVEFFVTQEGRLVANEMAPRPHNSGHFTQNACLSSQFDHQACVLAGFNLPATNLLAVTVMINVLGQAWNLAIQSGHDMSDIWQHLIQANMHLHLYGKKQAKIGRKMGHINCVFENIPNHFNHDEWRSILKNNTSVDEVQTKLIKVLWGI